MNTKVLSKPLSQPSTHSDAFTGDTLTRGEYLSWRIQGIIRNWYFLGIITLITVIAWLTMNGVVLQWWNLSASYMALLIESIVGIAMFSQTRRDAVVLREVRAVALRDEEILKLQEEHNRSMLKMLTRLNSQEDLIVQLLERNPRRSATSSPFSPEEFYIAQIINGEVAAPEVQP